MNMSPLQGEDKKLQALRRQQEGRRCQHVRVYHKVTFEAQQLWQQSGVWTCLYEALNGPKSQFPMQPGSVTWGMARHGA